MFFMLVLTFCFLAAKINADIHLCDPKIKILESIKKCTKVPIFLNVYTTGIMSYLLHNYLIYKPIIEREESPCASCVLKRSIAISVFTGVIFPTVSAPNISYHLVCFFLFFITLVL